MRQRIQGWLAASPREKAPRPCGAEGALDGRKPCQMGWYGFIADIGRGRTVLDVGCGSGEGLRLLTQHARQAVGIDLDDRLERADVDVRIQDISQVPDKSFDVVVCCDVIEHVVEDRAFIGQLFRVAREAVFVTTPNYTISRNRHPYHVREYTPAEFEALFAGRGALTVLAGSSRGLERVEIDRRGAYYLVNTLYAWKPAIPLAKVVKRLLRVKVWKHQAALVRLPGAGSAPGSPAVAA